jgi:NAD(P)-dependent dehydrogenase (short-subunit alcohol dehydrogenase family)
MDRLKGKVAIITGGATGVGEAVSLLFAEEGARVVVMGRRLEPIEKIIAEIKDRGGEGIAAQGDVSSYEDCERAVKTAIDTFGPPTVLANVAGVDLEKHKSLWEIDEEAFSKTLDINVKGTWHTMKAVIPTMIEAGGGSIVNCSSLAGKMPLTSAGYAASKIGVIGLTVKAAREVAQYNIRVNAFSPGAISTPMAREQRERMIREGILTEEQADAGTARLSLLGRMSEPIEQARAALFLACDESSFITGQDLIVDGGANISISFG